MKIVRWICYWIIVILLLRWYIFSTMDGIAHAGQGPPWFIGYAIIPGFAALAVLFRQFDKD